MPAFDASYTRKQGLRRTYAYTVDYALEGNLLNWSASVSCDGVLKGTPGGKISLMLPEQQDHQAHADFMARAAIEKLAEVDE